MIGSLLFPIILVAGILFSSIKVLREWEQGVILRFGRLVGAKKAGIRIVLPFIDQLIRVDQRTITTDIPPQDVITKDNVSIAVNAVLLFRVTDPVKAVVNVESFLDATFQFAQTTLRSVLGTAELDEVLAERDKLNRRIQEILDLHTEPWGIKVAAVEIKQVDLPKEMQRAIAQQAEAERQRRAKIIAAEGEAQAAAKLVEAAQQLDRYSSALQLRYLQTLKEIAAEHNSTILFPIPIDLFKPFLEKMGSVLPAPKDK